MWITEPYQYLESYDIAQLTGKVLSLSEEAWYQDEALRQQLTVERQTHSIFLQSISAGEFASILQSRPLQAEDVKRQAGWDLLNKDLEPLIKSAISHYPEGGIATRIQLARMQPGAEIKPHIDQSKMLIASHRLHVPITTNKDVVFLIDGQRATMEAGKLYELNNRLRHSVVNNGTDSRIHLIIDYLPPENNHPAAMAPRAELVRKQREMNIAHPPPEPRLDYPLPKVIATSVVRGANQNESHGGIYLVNLSSGDTEQVVDWNTCNISWEGRGWDRGLRGIAIYDRRVYIAASDELFCFDYAFKLVDSWKNPFLRHAHEISLYKDQLLVTSTGFDSLLRFNLLTHEFDQGWLIRPRDQKTLNLSHFDPRRKGPKPGNSLHLNNVFQDDSGIYVSGRGLPMLLQVKKEGLRPVAKLPTGTHNAHPYAGGVLYNDTNADMVAYEAGNQFCYLDVPRYPEHQLKNADLGDERLARQAFGRGLCSYRDNVILAGSSPSTVTAWDLTARAPIKTVNLSMDIRNAIHGLEIWPD